MKFIDYQKISEQSLGSGAFGFVFQAEETSTRKQVAVKVQIIKINRFQMAKRLIMEAMGMNVDSDFELFNFKQIIKKKILFSNDYCLCIIESEPGVSLREIITQKQKNATAFTQEEKDSIVIDLIEHLFSLHMNQIAHFDIKPENIIYLQSSKRYIIIDFGECQEYQPCKDFSYRKLLNFRGTPFYCSPLMRKIYKKFIDSDNTEIYQDPFKSDVFSLGLIFLEVHLTPNIFKRKDRKTFHELYLTKNKSTLLREQFSFLIKECEDINQIPLWLCMNLSILKQKELFSEKLNKPKIFPQNPLFFYQKFNILDHMLSEKEKKRFNIFNIALLLNMVQCFYHKNIPGTNSYKILHAR